MSNLIKISISQSFFSRYYKKAVILDKPLIMLYIAVFSRLNRISSQVGMNLRLTGQEQTFKKALSLQFLQVIWLKIYSMLVVLP